MLQLPSHVKTILISGAGGYVGQKIIEALLKDYPEIKIIATDIRPPPIPPTVSNLKSAENVTSIGGDLSDEKVLLSLFDNRTIDAVLALHGIMSGGSELDFELGWRVNVDSHVALLKATKKYCSPSVLYCYLSSQAVFGGEKCLPEATVDISSTPIIPESSYGAQKAIVELYVFDYCRKGYIDARILRLPTVTVRSGVPSSAASSFLSGLIREPLQGMVGDCPIADSPDAPELDIKMYCSRVKTVIHNILYSLTIPAANFSKTSRTILIPGITVTTRDILAALETVGGKEALALVKYRKNETTLKIVKSWPGNFIVDESLRLGFTQDDPKTGFLSACQDFKAELDALKKA